MRLALAILLLLPNALQAQLPNLAAVVTTEQRSLSADGLSRQVRFQERLVRTAERVWLERIIPKGAPVHEEAHEHRHRHLDLDVAARFVTRDELGSLQVAFVHRGERTVVQLEPRDFPEVGFRDSWAVVAHLVDPALLASMQPMTRDSGQPGASWYEKKNDQGFLRVLWSKAQQLALAVESSSADGNRFHSTTVELQPFPAKAPWLELEGYKRKDYTDLLD